VPTVRRWNWGNEMYGWIWRRLPFGLPGKMIGSALLIAAVVAVLWFWVFPAADPLLPFNDVEVTNN
jgi:hypothetical protein